MEDQQQPRKLWLWKNFVDGKREYWAFDNPYPIHLTHGDPQTLGEPCGYALFKPSRNGRPDVPEEKVLAAVARVWGRASPSSSVLERARDALNDLMLVAQLVKFQADNSGRTPYTDWDSACSDLDRAQSKARSALAEIDRALGGGNG